MRHVQSIDGKRRMDGYFYYNPDWHVKYEIKVKGYKKSWGKWRTYKTECYIEPTQNAPFKYIDGAPHAIFGPNRPFHRNVKELKAWLDEGHYHFKVWTRGVGENDAKIL